jgi:polyferredoxin
MGGSTVVQPRLVRDQLTGKLLETFRTTNWRSIVRPRTIVYFIVWSAVGLGMLTALSLRSPLSVSVLHDRNPLYVQMRDGSISNGYDIKVLNMTPTPRTVTISLEGLDGAALSVADQENTTPASVAVSLEPDRVMTLRAYVQVAPDTLPVAPTRFVVAVASEDGVIQSRAETTFEVPEDR